MNVNDKLFALDRFYADSFTHPNAVATVATSGSYATKVWQLAQHGQRAATDIAQIGVQVNHLRCAFMIMDDLIDEDTTRNGAPAFWTQHGATATIQHAAWEVAQSRTLAGHLGSQHAFEQRLRQVIDGARLEVTLEWHGLPTDLPTRQALWWVVVQKEASFRAYLAEALDCASSVVEAAYDDGVAAQILDDALSAQYGKDGRAADTDERLGRLTYMAAYAVTPAAAEALGRAHKTAVAWIWNMEDKHGI